MSDHITLVMSRGIINAFADVVKEFRPELSSHECLVIACRMVDELVATGKIILAND